MMISSIKNERTELGYLNFVRNLLKYRFEIFAYQVYNPIFDSSNAEKPYNKGFLCIFYNGKM